MGGRAFVVIFFFWAFLAVISPSLLYLSKYSKYSNPTGRIDRSFVSRRVILRSDDSASLLLAEEESSDASLPQPVLLAATRVQSPGLTTGGSAGAEEIDKRRLSRKMAGDLQNYPREHIAPVPTPAPAPAQRPARW